MHLFISAGKIHQLFVMQFLLYKICNHTERHTEYKINNMKRKFKRPGRKFFILNQIVKGRKPVILSCV